VAFDTDNNSVNAGDELILVIKNVDQATIVDASKPFLSYTSATGAYTTLKPANLLTAVSDSKYKFKINTANLEPRTYKLNIPVGTFTFSRTGYTITDKLLEIQFVILSSGGGGGETPSTIVTPTMALNKSTIDNPGESLTLTIGKVDVANLKSSANPYCLLPTVLDLLRPSK
jgi:hypothetical protein